MFDLFDERFRAAGPAGVGSAADEPRSTRRARRKKKDKGQITKDKLKMDWRAEKQAGDCRLEAGDRRGIEEPRSTRGAREGGKGHKGRKGHKGNWG